MRSSARRAGKVEEDTDRDRYMSPLEAKEYGIIDHIVGGEEAVFNVKGSLKKFPKVRPQRRARARVPALACPHCVRLRHGFTTLLCSPCCAQVKEEFLTDRDDMVSRNIMDGDPFLAESPSWRFRSSEVEPYMPSQAPGTRTLRCWEACLVVPVDSESAGCSPGYDHRNG